MYWPCLLVHILDEYSDFICFFNDAFNYNWKWKQVFLNAFIVLTRKITTKNLKWFPCLFVSSEQPIFSCKAHVFHIDPKTKRSWISASSAAVSVSFFYDSTRSLYRIISVEGTKVSDKNWKSIVKPLSATGRAVRLTLISWKMPRTSQSTLFIFQVVTLPLY